MDLDEKEEDLKMDLDEEEEDPEIDLDDEEEELLPASSPPLSPLRTPPHMSESSFDYDILVTTTTTVGRTFKSPLSTYEFPEEVNAMMDVFEPMKSNLDATWKQNEILNNLEQTAVAAKAARAVAAAETTSAAAIIGDARGSNNAGPVAGVGGPNVAGPTVVAIGMNVVPELRGCSVDVAITVEQTAVAAKAARAVTAAETTSAAVIIGGARVFLISKCAENDKVKYDTSTLLD
nr:hypothetical protein [Tanacetum cinerariifolium]